MPPRITLPEAVQLNELADRLKQQAEQKAGPELEPALRAYFARLAGTAFREQLNTQSVSLAAEVEYVFHQKFPVPRNPQPAPAAVGVGDWVRDLNGLFAFIHLSPHRATKYANQWRQWRRLDGPGRRTGRRTGEAGWVCQYLAQALTGNPVLSLDARGEVIRFTAGLLRDLGHDPTDRLREVAREAPLPPDDLLRLQRFQLDNPRPDALDGSDGQLWSPDSIDAALRFWARADPLCKHLFGGWGWLPEVDFRTPLKRAELDQLDGEKTPLWKDWKQNEPRGLGRVMVAPNTHPPGTSGAEWSGPSAVDTVERIRRPAPPPAAPGTTTPPPPLVATADTTTAASPSAAAGPAPAPRWVARPGERHVAEPVTFVLVGPSGVGKTSFLCAAADALTGPQPVGERLRLTPEKSYLAFYRTWHGQWQARQPSRTGDLLSYELAVERYRANEDRPVYLRTIDYPGERIDPESHDPALQQVLRDARGFLFFLDHTALTAAGTGPASTIPAWYASILRWWRDSNPTRHIPVGLVINKADELLKEDLAGEARRSLLPDNLQQPLIKCGPLGEGPFKDRLKAGAGDPPRGVARLNLCLTQDPDNYRTVRTKRLVWGLLERFEPFFDQLLQTTFRYQIFLTASVLPPASPARGRPALLPFGATEPIRWMARELYRCYTPQLRDNLAATIKLLADQVKDLAVCRSSIDQAGQDLDRKLAALTKEQQKGTGLFGWRARVIEDLSKAQQALATDLAHKVRAATPLLGATADEVAKLSTDAVEAQLADEEKRSAKQLAELKHWHDSLPDPEKPGEYGPT